MSELGYPIVVTDLSEEDGGGFIAFVPDLRGCMADGATAEEALRAAQSAIGEWIDEAKALGRSVPSPMAEAERAAKERRELYAVLKAQDKLIKKQAGLLKAAQAEVNRVGATAAELLAHEGDDQEADRASTWQLVAVAERRRKITVAH